MANKSLIWALVILLLAGVGQAKELTVCRSGCDYGKIQNAIDRADPGDIITVKDGVYYEKVKVNKSLTIRSQNGAANTVIYGSGNQAELVDVSADDVVLAGFSLMEGYDGVHVHDASNCTIRYNDISGVEQGITFENSRLCSVWENNISAASAGILVYNASNNIMTGNIMSVDEIGIYLFESSTGNTVTDNRMDMGGIMAEGVSGNNVSGNTLGGKNITYLEGVQDYAVGDTSQVILINCRNITVTGLNISNAYVAVFLWGTNQSTISGNNLSGNIFLGVADMSESHDNTFKGNYLSNSQAGLFLAYGSEGAVIEGNTMESNQLVGAIIMSSNGSRVIGNTVSGNMMGLFLSSSKDLNVSHNVITSNYEYGLISEDSSLADYAYNNLTNNSFGFYMVFSNQSTFAHNRVADNALGLFVLGSNGSVFYDNYFNNTQNALTAESANDWNIVKTPGTNILGGPYIGGNYWSDYNGYGTNEDGFGSNPYDIGDDNVDRLPLILESTACALKGNWPPCGNVTLSEAVDMINRWMNGTATLYDTIRLLDAWSGQDSTGVESDEPAILGIKADSGEHAACLKEISASKDAVERALRHMKRDRLGAIVASYAENALSRTDDLFQTKA
jgi:parallel beta-helix repeat protein